MDKKTVIKWFRKEQKLYPFLPANYFVESLNAIYLQTFLKTLQDSYSILYHFLQPFLLGTFNNANALPLTPKPNENNNKSCIV